MVVTVLPEVSRAVTVIIALRLSVLVLFLISNLILGLLPVVSIVIPVIQEEPPCEATIVFS